MAFTLRCCPVFCAGDGRDGLVGWMRNALPHQVLGLQDTREYSLQDVKDAFRSKVKEFHPDVYKGTEDAAAVTQCLIQAYEQLSAEFKETGTESKQKNSDPFEVPEADANDIFVNEILCIGRGCPYACVERAPNVFRFNPDTGRAHVVSQGNSGDYTVQLAVGQCPRNCIHYVTPEQRKVLEELLYRAMDDPYSDDYYLRIQGLISRANFENGRYRGPKRKPKRSDNMVDFY